jgi:dTDP-4-amino-4,6-dideoxygalactose transaminase
MTQNHNNRFESGQTFRHSLENLMQSITVTKPSLPPLEEYVELLKDIWDRQWLTNNGHYHEVLEKELARYLGVCHVSLFCNGTIALQVGLQALRITGDVITTPFSFPATTHALYWNHCTPVFCDIDPGTGNLDPDLVESLITPKTTAILPVHVYGTPCHVKEFQSLADRHGLKLIYDAAHAFGVTIDTVPVVQYGDLSMLSFHATKVFNTAEGGALITNDPELKKQIDSLKNFGFADEITVTAPGTNGKMNELQAALGILQLKYMNVFLERRKQVDRMYRSQLEHIPGVRLLQKQEGISGNYSYFPIFIDDNRYPVSRDRLYEILKNRGYYGRRYFYPLISEFPMYKSIPSASRLPAATRLSRQVICLPIYPELPGDAVRDICDIIRHPPAG